MRVASENIIPPCSDRGASSFQTTRRNRISPTIGPTRTERDSGNDRVRFLRQGGAGHGAAPKGSARPSRKHLTMRAQRCMCVRTHAARQRGCERWRRSGRRRICRRVCKRSACRSARGFAHRPARGSARKAACAFSPRSACASSPRTCANIGRDRRPAIRADRTRNPATARRARQQRGRRAVYALAARGLAAFHRSRHPPEPAGATANRATCECADATATGRGGVLLAVHPGSVSGLRASPGNSGLWRSEEAGLLNAVRFRLPWNGRRRFACAR